MPKLARTPIENIFKQQVILSNPHRLLDVIFEKSEQQSYLVFLQEEDEKATHAAMTINLYMKPDKDNYLPSTVNYIGKLKAQGEHYLFFTDSMVSFGELL